MPSLPPAGPTVLQDAGVGRSLPELETEPDGSVFLWPRARSVSDTTAPDTRPRALYLRGCGKNLQQGHPTTTYSAANPRRPRATHVSEAIPLAGDAAALPSLDGAASG